MYCRKCGKENDDGKNFCSKCGVKLNIGKQYKDEPKAGVSVKGRHKNLSLLQASKYVAWAKDLVKRKRALVLGILAAMAVIIIAIVVFGAIGSRAPSKSTIKNDLQQNIEFLSQRSIEISEFNIVKRMTDKKAKNDIVYVSFAGNNEDIFCRMECTLVYFLYNDGWRLESYYVDKREVTPLKHVSEDLISTQFESFDILSRDTDLSKGYDTVILESISEYNFVTIKKVISAEFYFDDRYGVWHYSRNNELSTEENWKVTGTWKYDNSFTNYDYDVDFEISIESFDGITLNCTYFYQLKRNQEVLDSAYSSNLTGLRPSYNTATSTKYEYVFKITNHGVWNIPPACSLNIDRDNGLILHISDIVHYYNLTNNSEYNSGYNSGYVEMIRVVGMQEDDAKRALIALGLTPEIEVAESADVEAGMVMRSSLSEGAQVTAGSNVVLTVSVGTEGVDVPDIVNMTAEEAIKALTQKGFTFSRTEEHDDFITAGNVFKQSPEAHAKAVRGSMVNLWVSKGPEDGLIAIPNLIGETERDAIIILREAGLEPGNVSTTTHPNAELINRVCLQRYAVGVFVEVGTVVDFSISSGLAGTLYSFHSQIEAPTYEEDAEFRPGTMVQVILTTEDGQQLLDTETNSFPVQVNFTNIETPGGGVILRYVNVMDDHTVTPRREAKEVVRYVAFKIQ